MWSERYDRQLDEIFALQDEIMKNILFELQVKLVEGEQLRYWLKDKQPKEFNFKRWNRIQLILYHCNKGTPEGYEMARQMAHELIEKWPAYPIGYAWVSFLELVDIWDGRSKSPLKSMQVAEEYAQKAFQINESDPSIKIIFSWLYLFKGQHELAIAISEELVASEPNGAMAHECLGTALCLGGRYEEAIQHLELAIRLDPHPPADNYSWLGAAYAGQFAYGPTHPDKAIEFFKKALEVNPNDVIAHITMACIYSYQNRMEEARFHVAELLRSNPKYSLKVFAGGWLYKDRDALKPTLDLLRKAGLPEGL